MALLMGGVILRKLLGVVGASSLLVSAFFSFASAADMPLKAPPLPPAPVYSWTGFYIGANVGYSWGDWHSTSNQPVFDFETPSAKPRVDGWLGGGQAGYNWQFAPAWVIGIEGDIQGTGERASQNWVDPGVAAPLPPPPCNCCDCAFVPQRPGTGPAFLGHAWSFPWFGTVRGRIGITPDDAHELLLYVTGGLAFGETDYSFTWSNPGGAAGRQFYSLSDDQTRVGFAVGVGAEKKLWSGWSAKLEYLYVDLGTQSISTVDIDGAPFQVNNGIHDNILRIGVNYQFGGPVVARY